MAPLIGTKARRIVALFGIIGENFDLIMSADLAVCGMCFTKIEDITHVFNRFYIKLTVDIS